MKTPIWVPSYKSCDENVFSNYHTVPVLPVFSKLIERAMYTWLIMFVTYINMLYRYELGFQNDYAIDIYYLQLTE